MRLFGGRPAAGCLMLAIGMSLAGSSQPCWAQNQPKPAKLPAEAPESELDRIEPPNHAASIVRRDRAALIYEASQKVDQAFQQLVDQLKAHGCRELPGGYATPEYASGTFESNSHQRLSVLASPGAKPGIVRVAVTALGSEPLASLPRPEGAKLFLDGPANILYVTDLSPQKVAEACDEQLLAAGWTPYGAAGDVRFYKKGLVRLTARAATAPAQGGKTMLDYSTVEMAFDLPVPHASSRVQYSDQPAQVTFDSSNPPAAIFAFYRTSLGESGWQATTENPIQAGLDEEVIFRNKAGDLRSVRGRKVDEISRFRLSHQTAQEVDEQEKAHKAQELGRKKDEEMQKAKPLPVVALAVPAGATGVEHDADRLSFTLTANQAKKVVEGWKKKLVDDGWKVDVETLEQQAGVLSLSKNKLSLSIDYNDTGVLPAEVSVRARGCELRIGR